jgi:RNA polymerase primary sigma factor
VLHLVHLAQEPISLGAPVGEDKSSALEDFLVDRGAGRAIEQVGYKGVMERQAHKKLRQQIATTLKALSPRERRIVTLRYGLEDGMEQTRDKIGEELGISRERIRQIEATALRKLRHPSHSGRLRSVFTTSPELRRS